MMDSHRSHAEVGPDVLPGTAGRMPGPCLSFLELRVAHGAGMGQGPARQAAPGSRRDETCSAEIDSACAKVLPAGKTLVRRVRGAGLVPGVQT